MENRDIKRILLGMLLFQVGQFVVMFFEADVIGLIVMLAGLVIALLNMISL